MWCTLMLLSLLRPVARLYVFVERIPGLHSVGHLLFDLFLSAIVGLPCRAKPRRRLAKFDKQTLP